MGRKQQHDDCIVEFLNTIKHSAQAYPKTKADGTVFTAGGQLPDGNCHPLLDWDTQTVIRVPSPHLIKQLLGHTEILHELLGAEIWSNCVPPVVRLCVCQVTSVLPSATRLPVDR